jgi:hypothetical protein
VSGYTAQTGSLQGSAPKYGDVSDQVRKIYQTLVDRLEGEGACWGNDTQGKSFGQKYCAPALSALQQMSNTNEGLESMVDGICTWAKNYVNVDELAQQQAAQIADGTD